MGAEMTVKPQRRSAVYRPARLRGIPTRHWVRSVSDGAQEPLVVQIDHRRRLRRRADLPLKP
jgi:hypothetical protein